MNDRSGWQESHWWGLWGPKRLDEWASAYEAEFKVPVSAMAWGSLLRALQALGWAALAECKSVWKVFCKLRAGESAEVAATAKQVAARAKQQRWRETEQLRAERRGRRLRRTKSEHEGCARSWTPPGRTALRVGHAECRIGPSYSGGPSETLLGRCTMQLPATKW